LTIDRQQLVEWVKAARGGSSHAFNELYRRHVALVHGILLSRFRPAIAEEATQECFLLAFRKLDDLREPASFGPWVAAIARRFEVSRNAASAPREWDESIHDVGSVFADPELSVDADVVLNVIRGLPEAYRETLVLRLVEGMSGPEIAAATGRDPKSVRVNLHRGMKKLRAALGFKPRPEMERHG
jgi:RNA polymerase sigma-70 factor, ECF subfamily